MATRAVFTFTGFPGIPERSLYLHHDGYPTGAAWRLAQALLHSRVPADLLAAFLSTQPLAVPLAQLEQAADAEYRYGVQLFSGAEPSLQVQCWRLAPGETHSLAHLTSAAAWWRKWSSMKLATKK